MNRPPFIALGFAAVVIFTLASLSATAPGQQVGLAHQEADQLGTGSVARQMLRASAHSISSRLNSATALDFLLRGAPPSFERGIVPPGLSFQVPDGLSQNAGAPRKLPIGRFLEPYQFGAGVEPQSIAAGDFNGDGKLDLAVVNYCENPTNCTISSVGTVSILLGNGDGTFQPHVDYVVDSSPVSVAVNDFNGDGRLDLVVANFCGTTQNPTDCEQNNPSGTVSILLGNGDGTFQPHADYATNVFPNWVAVGDFNGDGKPDLVTANSYFGNGQTVSVLLGNGDGTFQPHVEYGTGNGPTSVAVADFNHDGKVDLAVTDEVVGKVSILLGKGDGTFQSHVDYPDDARGSVIVADFNQDGNADLAALNSAGVVVLLGNGDGSFQPPVTYAAGDYPISLGSKDFNGDGKPDLVVANPGSDTVSILLGNGDGTFQPHVDYGTGYDPISVVVGDFNGDHKRDLVTANSGSNTVSELIGNGDGSFRSHRDFPLELNPAFTAVWDFNGDGIPDLVVANAGNGADSFVVSVLFGNGDGTFQPPVEYQAGEEPVSIVVADFNGDGIADLAVADDNCPYDPCPGGYLSVLLGNADGTFQAPSYYGSWRGAVLSIATGDFNGDGKLDLVVADMYGSTVGVLLGKGDGTFGPQREFRTGHATASVAVGDFNGDGKLDIVSANFCGKSPTCQNGPGTVSILLGNGDGTFRSHVDYQTGNNPLSVAVGDFNGDGKTDLAVADSASRDSQYSAVSVLLGNGDGTFQKHVDYSVGSIPLAVTVTDINGDGRQDLAVANGGNKTVSVLLGNGDGTFQPHVDYATGNGTASVVAADLNGDGKTDLVTANYGNTISVLLNTAGTRVILASSPNPSDQGERVTFTATVTPTVNGAGTPTGTVTFKRRSKMLTVKLVNGVATFATAKLPVGHWKVTAIYSGDTTFAPNKSSAINQVVNP
jgi:hypothetical protein